MSTPHAFECRCEGCIVKYFQPTHDAAPTQGADHCINCGMATDPKCACERGRALVPTQGADARPVAWAATSEAGKVEALGFNQSRRFDTPLFFATRDAAPSGWKLAMRVLQSDLYATLDDAERAECDALIRANPYSAPRDKS